MCRHVVCVKFNAKESKVALQEKNFCCEVLDIMIYPLKSGGGLHEAFGKICYTETELATTNSYSKNSYSKRI